MKKLLAILSVALALTLIPVTVNAAPQYPGQVLDLRNWYLTTPQGQPRDPDTIHQPRLNTYSSKWFKLNESKDGVVFTANVGGVTTSGSKYPRSELREMNGTAKASWNGRSGTHTMELVGAVLQTPTKKPEVGLAQIHQTSDDLLIVMVSGKKLQVKYQDTKIVVLDPDYRLGTMYSIRIVATGGRSLVYYNGEKKFDQKLSSSKSYFKAGAYVLSNTSKGDKSSAVGKTVINSLVVRHE